MSVSCSRAIGVFGGTFNPVHIGHLRTALEIREQLALDEMRLMPSAQPPHRAEPQVSARHRAAMVALAIEGEGGLQLDERELRRTGPSWTIETLQEMRQELGTGVSLSFCVGMDSLVNLSSWHRWQELTDWAHLIVAARPGWQMPRDGVVAEWLSTRRRHDLGAVRQTSHGVVVVAELTLLPVAATGLRERLQAGRSVRYLTPDSVVDYIEKHRLYGRAPGDDS